MATTHFCVHGHFYQPPREDAFSGVIPQEFGAGPHGNWTERIYHECYLPNVRAGNFQKMSFNIGPTLFAWMEKHHPETVADIAAQENMVVQRTGFSNAIAQPYFHLIMPLASPRDRDTMIRWGIREYEKRFGHAPQGMWLPETAVDLASLSDLTNHGITFTILAPWQAKDPNLDKSRPYRIALADDNAISAFFYNGFLSGEISFNPTASENADAFVKNWLIPQAKTMQAEGDTLIVAASDGELYGHHQPYRDRFLSYLMDGAVEKAGIIHTFPALWLSEHPADQTTQIMENTSWSCHHGIERWRNVCGDAPNATWKKPLREFLDQMAAVIDALYASHLSGWVRDVWALRDAYIDVLLGDISVDDLIAQHAVRELTPGQAAIVKLLLEAQYERLRMFSSDAWFFYDLDRIEPLNALKYAAHAAGLVERATGTDPSQELISIASRARSEVSSLTADIMFLGFLKKFETLFRQDSA
jgi:alpha-amylase/alpha-mannosidase (GH57 family)